MPRPTTKEIVPSFECLEDLSQAIAAKDSCLPIDLYPRDGTVALSEAEARVAELVGVEAEELILCNSGMAAIVAAIETFRGPECTIATSWPNENYSQTTAHLARLADQGVKVVRFDASCTNSIDSTIKKHRPDILLAETVGNGPSTAVFDYDGIAERDSFCDVDPVVILDNTLPLPTTYPLAERLAQDPKLVVVESGTKAYTLNKELSGLIYCSNPTSLEELRRTRREFGATPSVAAVDNIHALLPESAADFNGRNRQIFETTEILAECLRDAVGHSAEYIIGHPALGAPDCGDCNQLIGPASPVLFISCGGELDQFGLTRKLWENPTVREYSVLGQSFGFDDTRILPDSKAPFVRIAGGANTDARILGEAMAGVIAAT